MRFCSLWLVAVVVGCGGSDGRLFTGESGASAGLVGGSGGAIGAGGAASTGGTAPACAPGDTRECVGPGACRGAQACDAIGWGECDCGATGNGGTPGTGGMIGAGGIVPTSGGSATAGSADAGVIGTGGRIPGMPPCDVGWIECFGVCIRSGTQCGFGTGGATGAGGSSVGGAIATGGLGDCPMHIQGSFVLDPSTGCGSPSKTPCPTAPAFSIGGRCIDLYGDSTCWICGFACMNGYEAAANGAWQCVPIASGN
jgi:hypothetical protein